MATFYSFIMIRSIFFDNADLALLTLGGLLINFGPRRWQAPYQVFVALACTWMRAGSPGFESGVEGLSAHFMSMLVPVAESAGSIHVAL